MNAKSVVTDDRGAATTLWALGFVPVLLVMLGLMLDYGAGIEARTWAAQAAASGARAGATHVLVVGGSGPQVDTGTAVAETIQYMAALNPPDRVSFNYQVNATAEAVTVTVTATFTPRFVEFGNPTTVRTERAEPQFGQ